MNPIKTFIEFVKIDSPSGEELVFSNYLFNKIKTLGAKSFQDERGNILVSIKGEGVPLLLVAHMDTVQPGRNIRPVIQNGVIKSSGNTILGVDNKAIVSCFFELINFIVKNRNFRHRPLEIFFTVSEESGISGIDTFDFERVRAKTGLCLDVAYPLGIVIIGSPFYVSQTIRFIGQSAHASRPEIGRNVSPVLGRFLSKIKQGRLSKDTLLNIGIVKGGEATNSVMGDALIKSEIRSFSKKEIKTYTRKLRSVAEESARLFGCKFIYEERIENHGYNFNEKDPHVRDISSKLKEFVGAKSVKYMPRYGGISDANNLNGKGIKTVNLGYGARDAHTVNENIKTSDLEKVCEFIKAFVTSN